MGFDQRPFSVHWKHRLTIPGSRNTFTQGNATEHMTDVKSLIMGRVLDNGSVDSSVIYTETTTWEFPVLAKYRFRWGRVNPFAEAGPRQIECDVGKHVPLIG